MDTTRRRDDRGDTLIELLIAVSIMGTAVAVLIGGIATAIRITDMHRKQAVAGAAVRDFAEAIENKIATSTTGLAACGAETTYQTAYPEPAGYSRAIAKVEYWNGSDFDDKCVGTGVDVRRLTLTVSSNDNRATETLLLVIRRPCRPGEATC